MWNISCISILIDIYLQKVITVLTETPIINHKVLIWGLNKIGETLKFLEKMYKFEFLSHLWNSNLSDTNILGYFYLHTFHIFEIWEF